MFILAHENSIANDFLIEIRDKHTQKDRMKFRLNTERLGALLAYEISKSLSYHTFEVTTPLGKKKTSRMDHSPVLICVLRAGIPFFQGFNSIFDKSDCGFVGAQRRNSGKMEDIEIETGYFTRPELGGKDVIIVDPMLATGKSFLSVIEEIQKASQPKSIHCASLLASSRGIRNVQEHTDAIIWTIDVDDHLNEHSYIIPGLGDAGDLSYGPKV